MLSHAIREKPLPQGTKSAGRSWALHVNYLEEMIAMSIIGWIVLIVGAWIVFSALLVTITCMNSSRVTRLEETQKALLEQLECLQFSTSETDKDWLEECLKGARDNDD